MKRRILLAMFAFILVLPVGIVSAEEVEVKGEAGQTVVVPSEAAPPQGKDDVHEEMKQKEHRQDEGMHGMMMGHHSTGWAIMIGVVMVVMMAAMVL